MAAAVGLALLALALAGVAPRVMASTTRWRHTPAAALLVWQATSLSAVVSALLAGPAALWSLTRHHDRSTGWSERFAAHPIATLATVLVTGVVVVFLLLSAHRVGTRLRTLRRRHRAMVDLLDPPSSRADDSARTDSDVTALREASVRVLEHPGASVYCLPGLRSRVVLTRGALEALSSLELEAVLAHESAHLQARHDLILEFFTVLHEAMPRPVRSPAALQEVHLLAEALADRRAAKARGPIPLARALTQLGGSTPEASPGAKVGPGDIAVRLRLIAASGQPTWYLTASSCALAAVILAAPVAILVLL